MTRRWQDRALACANLVFAAALAPSITSGNPPALLTCLATFAALGVIMAVNVSQRWWMASVVLGVTMAGWLILAVQA